MNLNVINFNSNLVAKLSVQLIFIAYVDSNLFCESLSSG